MSTLTNITRECIGNLKMLNEYIEMTYPEFDQVWLTDKVQEAICRVRMVENHFLDNGEVKEDE